MKITRLSLRDFRGFQSLELDLDPSVTALVGVNGAGKTSILDAIALLASCLQEGIRAGKPEGFPLHVGDVRVGASTMGLELIAELSGASVSWARASGLPWSSSGETTSGIEGLNAPIQAAHETITRGAPDLPLAVYFPTNRSALDIPARIRTTHEFDAQSAYDGALEGGASNFRGFFEWFREEEDIYNEEQIYANQLSLLRKNPSPLPAVRAAIEALLPGACGLRVERRPQRMTVEMNGVRLDVAQLSDGEKCLLALAGDLARRMALAASGSKDPLHHPVVVLIDEVELHLHPGLQRQILPRLRRVFPNAQFIVSTHSPQVLSSLHAANVRLVERFVLQKLERGTWRRDTNRILEAAFGDPGRPPEVAEKLDALRAAVDDDRFADARALIAELRGMIEGDDPDVFYYEQMIPPEDAAEPAS